MAQKIPVRRQHTGNRELDEAQRQGQELARAFNQLPFANGIRVNGITLTGGADTMVNHGLGRRPQGVLILRDYGLNVARGVGEAQTQPADMTKQIKLRTSVTCTVDLWIF